MNPIEKDVDAFGIGYLRLCKLRSWNGSNRLGFSVAQSSEPPYFVQLVESNSPAGAGGLRIRDVILAINDRNVTNVSFQELLSTIKTQQSNSAYLELLVIDQNIYLPLKEKNYQINPKLAAIIETPKEMPSAYQEFPKHKPRTCLISLDNKEKSLGFSVAFPEPNIGLFIQEVLPNSEACNASLCKSDRIIEVNDVFVNNLPSKTVKEKLVKAKLNGRMKLYVVDTETYSYFQSHNIPLASKEYNQHLLSDEKKKSDISVNSTEQQNYENQVDEEFTISISGISKHASFKVSVSKGDLTAQKTDVIVVCSTSENLLKSICQAGGDSMSTSYNEQNKKTPNASILSAPAGGTLACKKVYFLPWKVNSDESVLVKSIEKFVSDALEKAVGEKCSSIAFPAIGCGGFGCSIRLVASTMVRSVYKKFYTYPISVTFVIQPNRTDIYDEFQQQINRLNERLASSTQTRKVTASVGKGVIDVEMGDITKQNVDVIIGSSSSKILIDTILKVAGQKSRDAYSKEINNHPNSILVAIPPGDLSCKQIFFVKWEPKEDEQILLQSLIDLITIVVHNVMSHNFRSIAFPAIGCGKHGCSVKTVVKTMVEEMKKQLIQRNQNWTVKFVIQPNQGDVYDEFCKQVLKTEDDHHSSKNYELPPTWEKSGENKIRFQVLPKTNEYKAIASKFEQAITTNCKQIIKIERIQNERWYMQYLAHCKDFNKRLKMDTEQRLYHGCPEQAASSIIEDCFNRSFAGVNGTVYGVGVYFSSSAVYSHGYTKPNANGERCMFLARVLVGKTTKGNSSMKTRPLGFDSTTDGNHIFVTYHDAQAFAEYLITYK